eukprot:TRINITY_DN51282_c0_g1_i1.p1 TRINITY_DN51282_c0_g1~~TRINITY_DN51282_c0_g1_i1.p1  ORF type:complete len:233 (-),score=49.58 TRINITY_DN51282_c0_g1_i1:32-730(-)
MTNVKAKTFDLPSEFFEAKYGGGKGQALLDEYRQQFDNQTVPAAERDGMFVGSAFDSKTWHGTCGHLDLWHDIVTAAVENSGLSVRNAAAEDLARERLDLLLHDQVSFWPPTYWNHYVGKPMAMLILPEVSSVFGKSFRYHRQFLDATKTNVVLEFSAMLHDLVPCQGVDIVTFAKKPGPREEGVDAQLEYQIIDFKVMIRPPEAAMYLRQHMKRRIGEVMSGLSSKAVSNL